MQSQLAKPKLTMYCGLCTREIPEQEFAKDKVVVDQVGFHPNGSPRYKFVQRACLALKKSDDHVFEGEGAV